MAGRSPIFRNHGADEALRSAFRTAEADPFDVSAQLELLEAMVTAGDKWGGRRAWVWAKRALARLRILAHLGDAEARSTLRSIPKKVEAPDDYYDRSWSTHALSNLEANGSRILFEVDGDVGFGDLSIHESEGDPPGETRARPPLVALSIVLAATRLLLPLWRQLPRTATEVATGPELRPAMALDRVEDLLVRTASVGHWMPEQAEEVAELANSVRVYQDTPPATSWVPDQVARMTIWLLGSLHREDDVRSRAGPQLRLVIRMHSDRISPEDWKPPVLAAARPYLDARWP